MQVSDGTLIDTQTIAVSVTNVNEAPVITSNGGGASAAVSLAENSAAAATVVASDVDAPSSLSYSIIGGADAAKFTINATTGALSFVTAPNFEAPTDAGANNVYDLTVQVSDGTLADTQTLAVTVTNVNEAPVITSNGGGANAAVNVLENTSSVATLAASDVDAGSSLSYSISGGADAAKFTINATTGILSFIAAPNFALPTDAGANNVYDLTVQVSDGALIDSQTIAVTVTNVNEAPVITSNGGGASASLSVAENQTAITTVTATDADAGSTLRYSIIGGADVAKFAINATTGALSFVTAPNFEAPADAGANNVYDVTVQVSDGALADTQTIAVSVTNVNEAPVITSNGGGTSAALNVAENQTAVAGVTASDVDTASTLSYSITGGADAAKFAIDATTGALSFVAAPSFAAPTDADGDNVYDVMVQVSDGALNDTQTLAVKVTHVNAAPVLTSDGGGTSASLSVAENQTAVTTVTAADVDASDTLSYSIIGGADAAKFSIDAMTGVLKFIAAPNFEAPADTGANNVYELTVQVSDGALADSQTLAVTVTNVNEAPVITSLGGGANAALSMAENQTAVTSIAASDVDAASSLSYSIVGGTDAAKFSIDAATGVLSFIAAPNFEAPADADANNVYDLTVQVSDGALTDTQTLAVTVINVNEAPLITSNGGTADAAISLPENGPSVTTVAGSDVDAASSLSYSIVGGADAAKFSIDATTGVLSFVTAPNFEAPIDADGDNRYELIVSASDGSLRAQQVLTVAVTNVEEAPTLVSNTVVISGQHATLVLLATDPDTPDTALVYQATNVAGGRFERVDAPGVALNTFNQAEVSAGTVQFVLDSSGTAPRYSLQLSDGVTSVAASAPTIRFDATPELAAPSAQVAVTNEVPAANTVVAAPTTATPAVTAAAVASPVDAAPIRVAETAAPNATVIAFEPTSRSGASAETTVIAAFVAPHRSDTVNETSLPALVQFGLTSDAPVIDLQDTPRQDLVSALRERNLAQELDQLRIDAGKLRADAGPLVVSGAALSTGLSVGYVLWLARGGVLMASVMSALPAWASLDPLPVLAQVRRKDERDDPLDSDDDDDAVERLFGESRKVKPRNDPPRRINGPAKEPA